MSLSHALYFGSKTTLKTILMLTCLAAPSWGSGTYSDDDKRDFDDPEFRCGKPTPYVPPLPGSAALSERSKSNSPPAEGATQTLTPRRELAALLRKSEIVGHYNWVTFLNAIPSDHSTTLTNIWTTLAAVAVRKTQRTTEDFDAFHEACKRFYPSANEELTETIFNQAAFRGEGWEINLLQASLNNLGKHISRPQSSGGRDIVLPPSREALTTPQEGSSRSSSGNPVLGSPPVSPALSFHTGTGTLTEQQRNKILGEYVTSLLTLLNLKQQALDATKQACQLPREESETLWEEETSAPQARAAQRPLNASPPASLRPAEDDDSDTLPATAPSSPQPTPVRPTSPSGRTPSSGSCATTTAMPAALSGGSMKPHPKESEDTKTANVGRTNNSGGSI